MSATPATAQRCTQPGCTGTIEDGYCNVCGSPAGADPALQSAPQWAAGSPAPGARAAGASGLPGAQQPSSQRISSRTSSARLDTAAIGSARGATRSTRRTGTGSTRSRVARLGAGLTVVPPSPVADPLQAIMADPQVVESKRYCPSCGTAVGRSRDDVPGRTQGFCPSCGSGFDFNPQLKPGDVVGGQYEVVGCLAHGGLGWIYLARDQNVSGRWVVLKGLLNAGDKDAYDAAVAEREFLAEVEHPLIVEIYNFALHDGNGYTVMEYVGGKSLKEILKDRRDANNGVNNPLPVDQALAYILEVLPAFSYLHDHGLLYCDFKPDNIIQQGEGIKLIDLGGVRRLTDQVSAIFGTTGFQAPEVPEVGPSIASDIYTIGRTLATLVLDFKGNTSTYVASLPPVDQTAVFQNYDSFYRLLEKACAPDPSDRFGSIDEMRSQVLGVLGEVVATDRGPGSPAQYSNASTHFAAPAYDGVDVPLAWNLLPELVVDPSDPMASWLSQITDPVGRLNALSSAQKDTIEVQLARAQAAIEVGQFDLSKQLTDAILNNDPWEWRALWVAGLRGLAQGEPVEARAAFNAVYGQVPGELAPKLALAVACEISSERSIAERLYVVCARTDSNYTAAAAFGLARIRATEGDIDGALHALALVPATRGSYPRSRVKRASLLVNTATSDGDLNDALLSLTNVQVEPLESADLEIAAYKTALTKYARATGPGRKPVKVPTIPTIGGVKVAEGSLRDALEAAYRTRARLSSTASERVPLIDLANSVRRRTLT